jgi:DNA-binding protein HU-beta
MNKAELVAEVADRSGLTKRDAEKAVNAIVESIEGALTHGEKVSLVGFGTFEVRTRAARSGRNPRTGATIKIASSKVPAFKAGKALKDTISK